MNAPASALSNPWAARIAAAWRKSLDGVFETGRELLLAKSALAHGQFMRMVETELPFRARVAQHLMQIAQDERLQNAQHAAHLPAAWTSLYELTKFTDDQFSWAIERGVLSPDADRVTLARFRKETESGSGTARPLAIEGRERVPSEEHLESGLIAGAAAGLMATASDVTFADLVSGERGGGVAEPRKIALYLAHAGHGVSQTALAAMFCMDRTNVVHAVKDIEERRSDDPGAGISRLEAFLASRLNIRSEGDVR